MEAEAYANMVPPVITLPTIGRGTEEASSTSAGMALGEGGSGKGSNMGSPAETWWAQMIEEAIRQSYGEAGPKGSWGGHEGKGGGQMSFGESNGEGAWGHGEGESQWNGWDGSAGHSWSDRSAGHSWSGGEGEDGYAMSLVANGRFLLKPASQPVHP